MMTPRSLVGTAVLALALAPGTAAALTIDFTAGGLGLAASNVSTDLTDDQPGLRTEAEDVGGSYLEINTSGVAADAGPDHLVTVTGLVNQTTPDTPIATWDYYFGVLTVKNQSGSGVSEEGGLGVRSFVLQQAGSGEGPAVFTRATAAGDPTKVDLTGGTEVDGGSVPLTTGSGGVETSDLIRFDFDGAYLGDADSLQLGLTSVFFSNDDAVAKGLRVFLDIDLAGGGTVSGIFSSLLDPTILAPNGSGRLTLDFSAIPGIGPADFVTGFAIAALDDDTQPENLTEFAEDFRIASLTGDFVLPEATTAALLGLGLLVWGGARRR